MGKRIRRDSSPDAAKNQPETSLHRANAEPSELSHSTNSANEAEDSMQVELDGNTAAMATENHVQSAVGAETGGGVQTGSNEAEVAPRVEAEDEAAKEEVFDNGITLVGDNLTLTPRALDYMADHIYRDGHWSGPISVYPSLAKIAVTREAAILDAKIRGQAARVQHLRDVQTTADLLIRFSELRKGTGGEGGAAEAAPPARFEDLLAEAEQVLARHFAGRGGAAGDGAGDGGFGHGAGGSGGAGAGAAVDASVGEGGNGHDAVPSAAQG